MDQTPAFLGACIHAASLELALQDFVEDTGEYLRKKVEDEEFVNKVREKIAGNMLRYSIASMETMAELSKSSSLAEQLFKL